MQFDIYKVSEKELVEGCLRRDRKAQKQLYDLYAPGMMGVCLRYMRDPMLAEDVLIQAFTRVFEKIGQYQGAGSLAGWIKTIVIREALGHIRKNQHLRFETDLDNADACGVISPQNHSLESEDLLRMVQDLPPGYRTVFNLFAIDGFSHKEIAEQLNISENTSKSQLSRARVFLQEKLTLYEYVKTQKGNDIATR